MVGKTNSQTGGAIKGEKLNISLRTNQASHDDLLGAIITVAHPGGTTQYAWEGYEITVDIPPYVEYSVTYPEVEGYKTPEPFTSTAISDNSRTLTAEYQTTVITASIKSNQTDTSDLANATITIGGKALKNGQSAKFPTGTSLNAVFSAVTGYATPASQNITAANASMTVSGTYNSTFVTVVMADNQSSLNDIANATASVSGSGITTQSVKTGGVVKVPTGTSCTITWNALTDYKTPSAQTFTTSGASMSKTGTYQTELVSVTLSADDGSSVNGAIVTINGKNQTWNGTTLTQKVAFGTTYSVSVSDMDGYATPAAQTGIVAAESSRNLAFTYVASALKVVISSNQGTDATIAAVKATVKYGTTTLQVGNGETIGIPTDQTVTVTYPAVTGYATPSAVTINNTNGGTATASGEYKCSVVTVTLTDNQTSYNDIASATASVTGGVTTTLSSGGSVKVPWGQSITITGSAVSGYKTPSTSYTAADKTRAISLQYLTQILTVNVVGSGATPSGYTITVKNTATGATIGTQTTSSKVYKIPYDTSYSVSTSALAGYNPVDSQSGTANSQSNTIAVTYVYNPTVDLSKQDIFGNTIAQTTANCYVIKEAGDYKFPLVYGCALKNGATNTESYTKNSGSYSHDFVTHDGSVITSPYIETVEGNAASAQLSISDTDGIFTDISIIDGSPCRYVQFSVTSVPATGANGVISIKNSSGDIMWSWHIWVWADDLTPVEITNSTSVKYKILPVNLASKWDDTAKTKIKNWFYQFGRPTPLLCPSAYNSTSNHASYGALSYTVSSAATHLYKGIQNPTTFYKHDSSYYDWFDTNSGKTYNLWDAGCTSAGNSDNNVKKTVYDPCPVGFKMPNGNTFTYFSASNAVGSFANGWKFKRYSGDTVGVFFPASGYRNYSDGSLSYVGSYGFVWLSSARSQSYAFRLSFYSGGVNPQGSNSRAGGCSVRPVQE